MLRDVSFPHLLLFANVLRKHLVLRKVSNRHLRKYSLAVGRWRYVRVSDSPRWSSLKDLSFVPQAIISFIKESWRVSNSYSELSFFSSVTKSQKFYPSCCWYVKNVWWIIVMFFLGLQYSENFSSTDANLILLPIKLKF